MSDFQQEELDGVVKFTSMDRSLDTQGRKGMYNPLENLDYDWIRDSAL